MPDRLQKILAHAGISSRRSAERMIEEGRVRVNGLLIREMGVRADPHSDVITVDGKRVSPPGKRVYILLNKPRNTLSTRDDPRGRPTVLDLLNTRFKENVYPVGRLDFASEGLLILTNDGEFTRFMTRAGTAAKAYRVKVFGTPLEASLDRLRRGLRTRGLQWAPCEIETLRRSANSWYEVTLHQGKNRQIRRMFEAIGHPVMKLRRVRIGFLEDSTLKPGTSRHLTGAEVDEFYRRYGPKTDRGSAGTQGVGRKPKRKERL